MGFKERFERVKNEDSVKRAEKRRRELLEAQRIEEEVRVKREAIEGKFRKVMEDYQILEIMQALNEECLEGKGTLRCQFYGGLDPDSLEAYLEWDNENGPNDSYITAEVFTERIEGLFSTREKLSLRIGGNYYPTSSNRDSLEDAFARNFLSPFSHKETAKGIQEREDYGGR